MKKRNINLNKILKKCERKNLLSEEALELLTVYIHLNGNKVDLDVFASRMTNRTSRGSQEVLDFLKKEGIL